jgi:hypothetical protein
LVGATEALTLFLAPLLLPVLHRLISTLTFNTWGEGDSQGQPSFS